MKLLINSIFVGNFCPPGSRSGSDSGSGSTDLIESGSATLPRKPQPRSPTRTTGTVSPQVYCTSHPTIAYWGENSDNFYGWTLCITCVAEPGCSCRIPDPGKKNPGSRFASKNSNIFNPALGKMILDFRHGSRGQKSMFGTFRVLRRLMTWTII